MAPHAFADNLSLAYGQMFINENFIDEFADTDKRKLFQKTLPKILEKTQLMTIGSQQNSNFHLNATVQ